MIKNRRFDLAWATAVLGLLLGCATVTDDGQAWSAPERLDAESGVHGLFAVALDAQSAATVLWSEPIGVFSRQHPNEDDGDDWTAAERLDRRDEEWEAFWPDVAVNADGNAIGVWGQKLYGLRFQGLWSSHYDVRTGWDAPVRIDPADALDATDFHVAIDAVGNGIAIWQQADGTCEGGDPCESIWANRYTAGEGWGSPGLIENDDSGHATKPQLAVAPTGDAMAVWQQSDGSSLTISGNHFTGRWEIARRVDTSDLEQVKLPYVAMDPGGNATVVWQQSDGERDEIWTNRFTPSAGWGRAPRRISGDLAGDAMNPQVGLDADGRAIAIWNQFNGTTLEVWSNHDTPSSDWASAERIDADNRGDALRARIVVSASGSAVAVWPQFDGLGYALWANAYSRDGGWLGAEVVDPSGRGPAQPLRAEVAIDPEGNTMAVWLRRDPDYITAGLNPSELWAARFE